MPAPTPFQRISFNVELMAQDVIERGWNQRELSIRAGVADETVYRFFRGEGQTPKMAKKLAKALGRSIRRYMITSEQVA